MSSRAKMDGIGKNVNTVVGKRRRNYLFTQLPMLRVNMEQVRSRQQIRHMVQI